MSYQGEIIGDFKRATLPEESPSSYGCLSGLSCAAKNGYLLKIQEEAERWKGRN